MHIFSWNSTSSQSSLYDSQEDPSFFAALKAVISRKKKPEQTKPQSSSSSQEEAVSNSDYLEKTPAVPVCQPSWVLEGNE